MPWHEGTKELFRPSLCRQNLEECLKLRANINIGKWELSRCQLCGHWRHMMSSLWQRRRNDSSKRIIMNLLRHPGKPWWRHQMEIFSALLAIFAGNSPVTGEFPTQRPVTRSFNIFIDRAWINGSVNNGESGDLIRNRAHYDVTVKI